VTLPTDILRTERLVLSPLAVEDADEMAVVLDDERMHEFIGGRPLAVEPLRERYRHLVVGRSADGSEQWLNWIVRLGEGGAAVGTVQATVTADRAEVAWEVGVPWQGRGIASEAAVAMVDWLVDHGVRSIAAYVHPRHDASAAVAARAGLVPTAEVVDGETVWRRAP
jgi:RimJ/RimL family protein N-acetyltransferase